jgi:uncharacterized membrane protein
MPAWLLTAAYSLHMLATVIWIGGIAFQAALLLPLALQPETQPRERRKLLKSLRTRFQPLAWLCLAVLVGSGLTQMAANPNYDGLLVIDNRWSIAILLKHIAIAFMVALMAFQTWVLYPRWARLELILARSSGQADAGEASLLQRENWLIRIQLALSALVLILTAIARTA